MILRPCHQPDPHADSPEGCPTCTSNTLQDMARVSSLMLRPLPLNNMCLKDQRKPQPPAMGLLPLVASALGAPSRPLLLLLLPSAERIESRECSCCH